MKRLNHLPRTVAALGLLVSAAVSHAQQPPGGGAPPPCPPAAAEKKPFNPSAALTTISNSITSGLSLLKQAGSNPARTAQTAEASAQAASSGTASPNAPCTPAAASATSTATTSGAAPAATVSAAGASTPGSAAEPWTPPASTSTAPAGPLDPAKLPDIGGIHLGMSLADAHAALQKLYPNDRIAPMNLGPDAAHLSVGTLRVGDGGMGNGVGIDLTLPPSPQVVFHVARVAPQPHVARAVLLAGLRQKYGKEAFAIGPGQALSGDDTRIYQLWWVYDERGNPVSGTQLQKGSPFGCGNYFGSATNGYYMDVVRGTSEPIPTWCASSFVGVVASIGPDQILDRISIEMGDIPLLARAARATAAWMHAQAAQANQQNLQRAQEVQPKL
jgi:hypothetical protein